MFDRLIGGPASDAPAARRMRLVVFAAFFFLAFVVAAYAIRPWLAAPISFDTAASVLHFERIVSGRHLESALSTTPKPLLTVLYGLLYAASGDWRTISFATLGSWSMSVALAGALAWRIGGAVAAVFVAVALILSSSLLLETSWALGSIWALLLWLIAGLAATARQPRWGLAGVTLALAALARVETFLVIGLALAVLATLRFGPAAIRRPVPSRVWLLSLGLLALPIMLMHDWFLTGDPLFWTTVAVRYSAATSSVGRLPSLVAVAGELGVFVFHHGAATALAIIGFGIVALRRQWVIVIGIVALGPGVAAFLLVLAARHIFVDPRYFVPIEVAILFTAGIGLASVRIPELAVRATAAVGDGWSAPRWLRAPAIRTGVVTLTAAAAAVLCSPAIAPLDHATRATITTARDQARTGDLSLPALRTAISGIPDLRAWPGTSFIGTTGSAIVILAPVPLRPRLAVDLDLPLPRVAGTDARRLDPGAGYPAPGQLIVVDRGSTVPAEPYAVFEVAATTAVGTVRLVPLLADSAHGAWVVKVENR